MAIWRAPQQIKAKETIDNITSTMASGYVILRVPTKGAKLGVFEGLEHFGDSIQVPERKYEKDEF